MMYIESVNAHQYQKDNFDRDADNHPAGVHRRPVPRWKEVLPFLIVLIVFPLLAWGASSIIAQEVSPSTKNSQLPQSQESSQEAEPTADAPDEEAQTDKEEPEPEPSKPPVDLKKDSRIAVLNIDAASGTAARTRDALSADGYTAVVIDNSRGRGIIATSVYYSSPDFEDTAKAIAEKFKIEMVEENTEVMRNNKFDIVVFVRSGFNP
ncbi:MAG: LytR C-terminal domain-containing protein [Eubacteriales bacterium]|nr:LytR C-terminal domain-containing protein [Eubacteriales bacterium]